MTAPSGPQAGPGRLPIRSALPGLVSDTRHVTGDHADHRAEHRARDGARGPADPDPGNRPGGRQHDNSGQRQGDPRR
jgi:hypothetical protein